MQRQCHERNRLLGFFASENRIRDRVPLALDFDPENEAAVVENVAGSIGIELEINRMLSGGVANGDAFNGSLLNGRKLERNLLRIEGKGILQQIGPRENGMGNRIKAGADEGPQNEEEKGLSRDWLRRNAWRRTGKNGFGKPYNFDKYSQFCDFLQY